MSFWDELDKMVQDYKSAWRTPEQGKLRLAQGYKVPKGPRTPVSMVEASIITKLQGRVSFPPGHAHKRFIYRLTEKSELSDRGRAYLAFIAHRYRRQWTASQDELEWIVQWGEWVQKTKGVAE